MADTTQGKLISESTLIPYIRRQDVLFDADNLRPNKIARIWFDDIAMNLFTQKGNKIILNSKKVLTVQANVNSTAYAGDFVYQGSSNISPTFSAYVDSYTSNTLTIKTMSGNFDESANIYVENTTTSLGETTFYANITRVVNQNTSDIFEQNEGLYSLNTNSFVRVIGNSGENILYVNENFIQSNVSGNGAASLSQPAYSNGDMVFQTYDGTRTFERATFVGRVEYFSSTSGVIVITPISGRFNVNVGNTTTVWSRLWNSTNTSAQPIAATGYRYYNFANGDVLISVANTAKRVSILSHEHSSGLFDNLANTSPTGTTLYVSSTANVTNAFGNLIYFTAGTGLGQFRRITGVSGNTITISAPLIAAPTSNTKYSIGNHVVDENGTLCGILNIPEEPNFKFKTGERVFTITDTDTLNDSDYTMKAAAKFTTAGLQNAMQNLNLQFPTTPIVIPVPPTPPNNPVAPPPPVEEAVSPAPVVQPVTTAPRPIIPRIRFGDPIAQTFFTPKPKSNKVSYGVFVTSVDLFFGAKPSTARGSLQLPVSVKIARCSNGFPTKNYIAVATVKAKDVKVSTSPSVDDEDTITRFTFSDPVYLQPDTEYALVVYSDSPEYECYIAELGGNVLGADPPRRISEQPYSGSFFRSQNATTWTPYQNEDLMFVIRKAKFTSSGSATFNLKDAPTSNTNVDRLLLNTNKLTFPVGSVDFKVKGVYKKDSTYDTYNYITPQEMFEYGKLLDSSTKTTSSNFLNTRKIILGNSNSIQVLAEFASSDDDISPVFNKDSLSIIVGEHDVDNAGISNTIISITNRGAGYNAAGNVVVGSTNDSLNSAAYVFRQTYFSDENGNLNWNIGFYNITVTGGEGSGSNGFAVANTDGSNTISYIVVNSSGSGYVETPLVSIANGNAASGLITATAVAQGETGKRGGNIRAKYITRQITLEDGFESGDLRVFMDCVRPTGTDIQVYYKVLGSEDPERFSDKSWVRMFKNVDKNSKDTNQVIELEFRPDLLENKLKYTENGTQYPIGGKFKSFAVKVCLMTADSTVVPVVTNMRIVATPEG